MHPLTRYLTPPALLALLLAGCQSTPALAPASTPASNLASNSEPISQEITLQPVPVLTPLPGQPALKPPASSAPGSVKVAMPALTPTPARSAAAPNTATNTATNTAPKPASTSGAPKAGTLIPISGIRVPADFDYATSREVAVDIAVSNPNGKPYAKVMVAIYAPDASGLTPLIRGVTDATGHYRDLMRVANYLQALDVQVSGFGISNSRPVSIQNRQLLASFGPQAGQP